MEPVDTIAALTLLLAFGLILGVWWYVGIVIMVELIIHFINWIDNHIRGR